MRYVLVGTGVISDTYVAALSQLEKSQLVACVSRRGQAPRSASQLPVFASLAQVDIDFDAVILATPNGAHCEGAITAARLGKHVLSEKLLAVSSLQAQQMLSACQQAGVTLAVAFQRRTGADNRALKQLIATGALGKIFSAELAVKCWRPQGYYDSADYRGGWALDGGGPFIQQAAHNLDLYTWFFGLPKRLHAELGTFMHQIETEDHGAALLRFDNGMIGTLLASTATAPGFPARLEIHCEKGFIALRDDAIVDWQIEGIANPSTASNYAHDGSKSAAVADCSAHKAIIEDFEAAIREQREPLCSGNSAALTTQLIEMIYQAGRATLD